MNNVLVSLIAALAGILVPNDAYERIKARVAHWEEAEIAEHEWEFHRENPDVTTNPKKVHVLEDLKLIGIKLSSRLANLLIELAVVQLKGVGQ